MFCVENICTFRPPSLVYNAYVPNKTLAFSESRRAHQQQQRIRPNASRQRTRGPLRDRKGTFGARLRANLREARGNGQCGLVVAQKADRQCLRQQVNT